MSDIRALTILQPWASAIALGCKRIETRGWQTSHRGPLLIHAGQARTYLPYRAGNTKTLDGQGGYPGWMYNNFPGKQAMDAAGLPLDFDFPLGAIIGVCELTNCFKTEVFKHYDEERYEMGLGVYLVPAQELALGDFTPGGYGWVLGNVRLLAEPIPCRGKQGLWTPPADVLAQVHL